ncbi:hypothetical protein KO493_14095 [Tamlana agarivorans]|uniref:Uncharacterized protein n=1 Tax=Pseudotamlana agarivorans TaxID=481183 RepID=A0ACC5UBY5_9FLAO|nr:hypothetical protein [Tamlana agarivorans]MBU2951827.1 hypothetical protein [Tamlana agarivorans]
MKLKLNNLKKMANDKITIHEKENPPRIKEEYSTLSITITCDDPDVIIAPAAQKPATLKFAKPLVEKIEGPFDENNELVGEMEVDKTYIFKATKFKESTFTPIKHIWFAEQLDDREIVDLEYKKGENPYLDEEKNVCYKYKYKKYANTKIYAYVWKPDKEACIDIPIVIPTVVITNKRTGFTIQELKGMDVSKFAVWTPAVVVPTYEAQVVLVKGEEKEYQFSFNVTRDAWYSLGKNESDEHVLLNRAFVPDSWERNLYGAKWYPSYPNPISTTYVPSNIDAFMLTRFGKTSIPATPLKTQNKLDGSLISSPRINENLASEVMIHIGGTYKANGLTALGGSYGCFGYIQPEHTFDTVERAIKASKDDDYDDLTSNTNWKIVADKIKKLWNYNRKMHILLEERDETKNYQPSIVFEE